MPTSALKALLCSLALTLVCATAQAHSPALLPNGEIDGAWSVPWCDPGRPDVECGGFTVFLARKGRRFCGRFHAARLGLSQIDDGDPLSVRGYISDDAAYARVRSGRNGGTYRVKLDRDHGHLRWHLVDEVAAPLNNDIHLIALNDTLAPKSNESARAQLKAVREECAADAVPTYPVALHGTWDLEPSACSAGVNEDSDTPIRIEDHRLGAYEHSDIAWQVTPHPTIPDAWLIASESSNAPGIVSEDTFALEGDALTITSDAGTRRYARCADAPITAAPLK